MTCTPIYARKILLVVVCVLAATCDTARAALHADELLLVVNGNVPASVKTAEFYAKARLVPDNRIVKLNLPGSEEMTFEKYETEVIPPIRDFLRKSHLEQKVKCLVTFYGVPFRVGAKQLTPAENDEVADLKQKLAGAIQQATPFMDDADKLAGELDPSFTPMAGSTLDQLTERVNHALGTINHNLPGAGDSRHATILPRLLKLMAAFGGDAQVASKLTDDEIRQIAPPDVFKTWPARRTQIEAYQKEMPALEEKRYDPEARKRLREIVSDGFGVFGAANLFQAQLDYLQSDGTVSATDSELALIWWNYYSRSKWQANALNFRFNGPHPPVMMVMRLDGPQEGTATQIILASLKAEKEGLKGRVVIDSTNGTGPGGAADRQGGYRQFDHKLITLADIVKKYTTAPLTLDTRPTLLPPNSVKDVALYCGWYSVRNYIPACQFNVGAVGYHIASFEMVSLRQDNEKGWVAGLLNDGVAATVGAVAEPYLGAFPAPDEFFPLLMTGKLTLAEVYWKTVPMTSWMMCCIGDPLYTPYKSNPLLQVHELPALLRDAVGANP